VERRQNTRRALKTCGGAAALALGAVVILPAQLNAVPVVALAAVAALAGAVALVLRFTERPRRIGVPQIDHKVIH
jgi:hypothetical protein